MQIVTVIGTVVPATAGSAKLAGSSMIAKPFSASIGSGVGVGGRVGCGVGCAPWFIPGISPAGVAGSSRKSCPTAGSAATPAGSVSRKGGYIQPLTLLGVVT